MTAPLDSAPRREARTGPWTVALLAAVALSALNAVKPMHIDDPFTFRVAEQIVAHPTDPYGFTINWMQWPQPVIEELTPPVLPYWIAPALWLFGEAPVLWKLWMFPFALLLAGSVHRLLRRFAPGLEAPLTATIVLSPALLPGFNLMQDVPAIALGLAAVAVYLCASDRKSVALAALAGALAGLAAQTKYPLVSMVPVIVAHGVVCRRWWPAIVTAGAAGGVFLGWELLMQLAYGESMFMGQIGQALWWYPRAQMILPLIQLVGGTIPLVGLLGLAALGLPTLMTRVLSVVIVAAYGLLLAWPAESALFLPLGGMVWIVLGLTVWRLVRAEPVPGFEPAADRFLALWLLAEVGFFFATAPFPAARRVLGITIVASSRLVWRGRS